MMKRLAMFFVCVSAGFAGYSDGFITAGQYEYSVRWSTSNFPLVVDGGGADRISVRENGVLIVKSTSTPLLPPWDDYPSGIYDIVAYDNSQLFFLGGVTELITMRGNATAELRGGSINLIKSMQFTTKTNSDPRIDLYCQPGWSWLYANEKITGITGVWNDGSGFSIEFIDDATYDPVWTNINVIIPEPLTLLFLAAGGVLLPKRQRR
ncbi:MAG: hypothetical protein GX298_00140 [Planctomycetes bacterium]|nr:hypothetical protein [Planctomycetota bacterium]